MQERKNRIPVGVTCIVITDNNFQNKRGIKKGTLCKIVKRFNSEGPDEYSVEFLPYEKYKKLNENGPFLKLNEVVPATNAARVLYDRS